ncbi:HD domain-containing protein [Pelagibius sp.]|uniref:HD domain-containing protein n=1 Tax=Pelagibius sp. TaxID=1931238 RepID=UPI003BAE53B9
MGDRRTRAPDMEHSSGIRLDGGNSRGAVMASGHDAAERSPLLRKDWHYVDKPELDDLTAGEWALLQKQRNAYYAEQQALQALRFLAAAEQDASFGYQINNYRHCLQAATLAHRAGEDEETVVAALFHDIGFVACPDSHGAFAAALLANYVSEKNIWMLRHHAIFQQVHLAGVHDHEVDPEERERWRGHPHFDWTARFVDCYDQRAICARYDTAPLSFFEPMVQRVFARPPRRLIVD